MSLIHKSIAIIMPYLPKWFAKPFAKPYVAGEDILVSGGAEIARLQGQGFANIRP